MMGLDGAPRRVSPLRDANRRYQAMHPFGVQNQRQNQRQRGFDFNIPTALKGWVGLAPQGRGALHIIIWVIIWIIIIWL